MDGIIIILLLMCAIIERAHGCITPTMDSVTTFLLIRVTQKMGMTSEHEQFVAQKF